MRRLRVLLAALAVLGSVGLASAQDAGTIGVVASTSGAVGMVWHPTSSVAVRPTIDFAHQSTDNGGFDALGLTTDSNSATSVTIQISALLYLGRWDNLRAYVAPGYGRTFENVDNTFSTADTSNYRVEGLFGLQYALGSRFSVFGETGLRYWHVTTETSLNYPTEPIGLSTVLVQSAPTALLPVITTTSSLTGSTTRFGINFYF